LVVVVEALVRLQTVEVQGEEVLVGTLKVGLISLTQSLLVLVVLVVT
jgi:hypothetical protein